MIRFQTNHESHGKMLTKSASLVAQTNKTIVIRFKDAYMAALKNVIDRHIFKNTQIITIHEHGMITNMVVTPEVCKPLKDGFIEIEYMLHASSQEQKK